MIKQKQCNQIPHNGNKKQRKAKFVGWEKITWAMTYSLIFHCTVSNTKE